MSVPPPGFIADLGHVAFGLDWETKAGQHKPVVPGVPPNLLSTYEEEEYAPRAAECGAAAYIPKSVFGPDRLEEAWAAARGAG